MANKKLGRTPLSANQEPVHSATKTIPPPLRRVEPKGGYITKELSARFPQREDFLNVRWILNRVRRNLHAAQHVCRAGKTCEKLTGGDFTELYDRFEPTFELPSDVNDVAWAVPQRALETCEALGMLLRSTLDALTSQLCYIGEGVVAEKCAGELLDSLVPTLKMLGEQYSPISICHALFREEAERRRLMPAVLSVSSVDNRSLEADARFNLRLGRLLPYKIDPRRPLSREAHVTMAVIEWIDKERRSGKSIYRKVFPELKRRGFRVANSILWQEALSFHIDYFQGSGERRRKIKSKYLLEEDKRPKPRNSFQKGQLRPEPVDRGADRPTYLDLVFAPLTDIFRSVQSRGSDSQARTDAQLFNRAKQRILRAAHSLIPD